MLSGLPGLVQVHVSRKRNPRSPGGAVLKPCQAGTVCECYHLVITWHGAAACTRRGELRGEVVPWAGTDPIPARRCGHVPPTPQWLWGLRGQGAWPGWANKPSYPPFCPPWVVPDSGPQHRLLAALLSPGSHTATRTPQ